LFILARERARKHDVPFDLSLEWVLEKLQQGICEVTHIPFVFEVKHSIFAPSIDRRVSSLGYTSDNCRLVIFGYNAAKGAGSDEEVRQMAAAIIHRSTP
jgi:hypothetical protein